MIRERLATMFALGCRRHPISCYIAPQLRIPFDEAITKTEAALKAEGFGTILRTGIQDALKTKIGRRSPPLYHPGGLQPALAHGALKLEARSERCFRATS